MITYDDDPLVQYFFIGGQNEKGGLWMSFPLYRESPDGTVTSFEKIRDHVPLAGCKNGLIGKYLRQAIDFTTTQPYKWDIDVSEMVSRFEVEGNALFINANPKSTTLLTLFKIEHIWGYSAYDWTPIMLKLTEIFVDRDIVREPVDTGQFQLSHADYDKRQVVYTFLYLKGSIHHGKLTGQWTFPGLSATNSVFLWSYAWDYFQQQIRY